uniref:(northern house mosquito) hypothetical protein n=1 Tax=Culex pipiens TaxID=7175 RepID=A0A8D8H9G9_CULPI
MLQQQQTAKSDFLFGRRAANRKKSPPKLSARRFFGPQHSPAKRSHHTTPTLSVSVNFSLALRCDREWSGLLILHLQAQQQQQYSMNQHATAFALFCQMP